MFYFFLSVLSAQKYEEKFCYKSTNDLKSSYEYINITCDKIKKYMEINLLEIIEKRNNPIYSPLFKKIEETNSKNILYNESPIIFNCRKPHFNPFLLEKIESFVYDIFKDYNFFENHYSNISYYKEKISEFLSDTFKEFSILLNELNSYSKKEILTSIDFFIYNLNLSKLFLLMVYSENPMKYIAGCLVKDFEENIRFKNLKFLYTKLDDLTAKVEIILLITFDLKRKFKNNEIDLEEFLDELNCLKKYWFGSLPEESIESYIQRIKALKSGDNMIFDGNLDDFFSKNHNITEKEENRIRLFFSLNEILESKYNLDIILNALEYKDNKFFKSEFYNNNELFEPYKICFYDDYEEIEDENILKKPYSKKLNCRIIKYIEKKEVTSESSLDYNDFILREMKRLTNLKEKSLDELSNKIKHLENKNSYYQHIFKEITDINNIFDIFKEKVNDINKIKNYEKKKICEALLKYLNNKSIMLNKIVSTSYALCDEVERKCNDEYPEGTIKQMLYWLGEYFQVFQISKRALIDNQKKLKELLEKKLLILNDESN